MSSTLVQKLIAVYKEVDHVDKRGTNQAQGYKYVKASDLAHAIRNALIKYNVYAEINFATERTYLIERGKEKSPMQGVDVRATVVFHDLDSTSTITTSGLGSGADMMDKAVFKAQTGALKYALRNAFLVPDDTDPENDDENATPNQSSKAQTSVSVTTTKAAQPPKAEIPSATAAAQPTPVPSVEPAKEEPVTVGTARDHAGSSDALVTNVIPTEDELKGLRNRFKLLCDDLATGGLKASRGLPINRKVLVYLLKITGADKPETITRTQWNAFFDLIGKIKSQENGTKSLVQIVNEANEEKK